MKKGKIIFKDNKYMIRYLDTFSSRDNGGYEKDRTGWFEAKIDPNLSINILESLLNEEVNFDLKYYRHNNGNQFIYAFDLKYYRHNNGNQFIYAFINLSVAQKRDIKINQIIENK